VRPNHLPASGSRVPVARGIPFRLGRDATRDHLATAKLQVRHELRAGVSWVPNDVPPLRVLESTHRAWRGVGRAWVGGCRIRESKKSRAE